MKKIITLITLALILIIFVLSGIKWTDNTTDLIIVNEPITALPNPPSTAILSFSVLGDIHTNKNALEKAIKELWNINPNTDLMVLNGDITDEGIDGDYTTIKECLERNSKLLPKTIIRNIGNHEFYDYAKGPNTSSESKSFITRYLAFTGEEKVYHDKWIKGYHFISLGSEETHTDKVNAHQALISDEQLKWLGEKLSEDYLPGKPILVFLHQPYTSATQSSQLKSLLSKYPEVILFSSHTHTFLEFDNIAYLTQAFTAVHTGAVNGPIRWSTGARADIDGSQGLYVEIDDNKVVIRGRDFKNSVWIDDAVYTINLNAK